jgi:hypothetical protein
MKIGISKLLAIALLVLITSCGPKGREHAKGDGHAGEGKGAGGEEGHEDHGEKAEGAKFAEGKGIALMEETKKAIGLETVEAEERKITPVVSIEAQIYRAAKEASRANGEQTGSAYAAALLSSALAKELKPGDVVTLTTHETSYPAIVWKIDPASKDALNNVEVIIEISDPQNTLHVGDFASGSITQSGVTESVVAVPRSAVLETATGKYAYVENAGNLLRTPISTGSESADFIEIKDGLYSGDIVASKPVETLYLIELRATKGGGHSH